MQLYILSGRKSFSVNVKRCVSSQAISFDVFVFRKRVFRTSLILEQGINLKKTRKNRT